MTEFKPFNKILHVNKLQMSITQKLHGTNAQIFIEKTYEEWQPAAFEYESYNVYSGSRTRWLTPDNDNYGFCKWVIENREELITKLGEGRHYGEWVGKGINSGEGLDGKKFCLFNWRRWIGKELPQDVCTVPVLYNGLLSIEAINDSMEKLKANGSYLVPGFMKPEGIVIEIDGQLYKNVFDAEEVKWKEVAKIKQKPSDIDISYLLQPLRLEKLLSKDESYIRDYPTSLSRICSDYVKDLQEEGQFKSTDPDQLRLEMKSLGHSIYYFVKSIINAKI